MRYETLEWPQSPLKDLLGKVNNRHSGKNYFINLKVHYKLLLVPKLGLHWCEISGQSTCHLFKWHLCRALFDMLLVDIELFARVTTNIVLCSNRFVFAGNQIYLFLYQLTIFI